MVKVKGKVNIYSILQRWIVLLVLAASIIVFSLLSPYFLKLKNLYAIGLTISVIGIVSIGQTFCILIRGFDLSVGGVSVFCGMIVAFFTAKLGVPYVLSVFIGLAVGALIGFINGILITKGKINPFITTLAIWFILDGAVFILSKGYAIVISTKEFLFLGTTRIYGVPLPILILILFYIVFELMLRNTIFGRKIYLTGGNPEASRIAGIDVNNLTIKVYMLSSILAAFGGVILTSRMGAAQLTSGSSYPLGSIAAVVLGGTALTGGEGRLSGTIIGVMIIGVLTNGLIMLGMQQAFRDITTGLVLILAVLFQNLKYSSRSLAAR
ncbi:MAG: ABC transporter permease [Actinobacteria bacterium]|nr:ABC transporter permease [Actinomycetota bacterium]